VVLHDAGRTHVRLIGVLPELAERAPMAEKVPALVQLNLDGLQPMVVGGRERLLIPQPVLLLHQLFDVLAHRCVEMSVGHESLPCGRSCRDREVCWALVRDPDATTHLVRRARPEPGPPRAWAPASRPSRDAGRG